jgi:acetolactate synthase-1/2/3 large subunit
VADLVIDMLRRSNIDTLYCLPGVQNDLFFDALVDARDIRPVVTRHEQGAAYMAMGAAQVTGRPAAFCVVPGPGILNASAALTSAYWGYARVLGVVGQIATWQQGRNFGALHDLHDQTAILEQLTKTSVAIADPADAVALAQRALDDLHIGVPRPVTIEVPVNVWGKPIDGVLEPAPELDPARLDPAQVDRAARLLIEAERPLIVVGSGAYGASEPIIELAERLQAPVTTRRQGHGVVPTAHELFVPITVGHELWAEADVVLGIGTRMSWPLCDWGYDDELTLIQLNIDPAEVDRHGITAVPLVADAAQGTRALLATIGPLNRSAVADDLARRRERFDEATAHLEPQRSFTAALRAAIPDNGVIVEDVTQIGFACHLFYDHLAPRTFLTSGAAGTLGAGAAVAIGAADATDRPVIGVIGDGGFLFTATELATAAQYDIPCNLVVFSDGAYGNVQRIQKSRFGPDRTIASTLQNPDFAALTTAFGVRYRRAESPEQLLTVLAEAVDHDGPDVIEVPVGEMPDPWPYFMLPAVRGPRARASRQPRSEL